MGSYQLKDYDVRIWMWDASGSLNYKSHVDGVIRGTHVYILVFDVSNYESFLALQ